MLLDIGEWRGGLVRSGVGGGRCDRCTDGVIIGFFFFFSSRRRHTRSLCDWSSDVCSSDLILSNMPYWECFFSAMISLFSMVFMPLQFKI